MAGRRPGIFTKARAPESSGSRPSFSWSTAARLWTAQAGMLGLLACSTSTGFGVAHVPPALRDLASTGELRVLATRDNSVPDDLAGIDAIALLPGHVPGNAGARPAREAPDLPPDALARLRQFVKRGGRLVLLGDTAALAVDLGCEAERPETMALRWGFDARTVRGHLAYGMHVVSGRMPQLFTGLASVLGVAGEERASAAMADAGGEFTFSLGGAAPCSAPLCAWSVGAPQQGAVLATLATAFDGVPSPAGPPVLVHWPVVGGGDVLALGFVPEFEHDDERVRTNARRLLQNMLASKPDATALLVELDAAIDPVDPRAVARGATPGQVHPDIPMAPLVSHWGWTARLDNASDPGIARSVEEVVGQVLGPSWQAGADQLALVATDPDHGSPLAWTEDDALQRPEGYRGDAFGGRFGAAAFGNVADAAHGRAMLLQAFFDPPPVSGRARERLAALRFFARELADWRRLGNRAIDGFGLRQWFHDTTGYSRAIVQDLHPAATLYRAGELAPRIATAEQAIDAEDGALRGLAATGLTRQWRDGFPATRYPFGILDARCERALPSQRGPTLGGGSYGDWLLAQLNDFVRERLGGGASLWWRDHDEDTLGARGRDYVLGLSVDPLRAAVATQFAATGKNGYRAAVAALAGAAPAGFSHALPVPAAVHMLQNNRFRLLGSGGGLLFDPTGQARFRPGQALVLSPRFLNTRLFGGRPSTGSIRAFDRDFLQTGRGSEGGYGRVAVVGSEPGQSRRVPAMLAFDDQPRWPQRVHLEIELETGYYELEIQPRAHRHRGVLVIALDGTVLHCEPFDSLVNGTVTTVPVHVARSGVRTVELAVEEGGAVALDRLRLVRRGDVAAEGEVRIAAGHLAELGERSASSYHADRVALRTIGDFPGFVMRMRCEHAVRGLRIERQLELPGYTSLVVHDDAPSRLRRPFVLRSREPAMPDLIVAPLQLGRLEHFRFQNGRLTFHSLPEAGAESRLGFWFVERGAGNDRRRIAPAVLRAVDQPLGLELGDRGHGTLVNDLDVPWTRVVRLQSRGNTPYVVRENGWWTWRGAQAGKGGADYLRIWQLPGDVVEIVGGPGVLARTRPGPGSVHVLALRDVEARSVTARVLHRSRMGPPAVVLAGDFSEVTVNGQPWCWFDGRTVYLPDRPGDYAIEARQHAGDAAPRVACSRAPIERCTFDPGTRTLEIVTAVQASRPAGLPYTAILRGGRPTAITGGEIVDEAELPHAHAAMRERAAAGGALVRFGSGTTKVTYAN
ncbi:MAG: hypothetical protein NXI31_24950 [bacterium]|nr:hypothetical protein [bacterium]